MDAIIARDLGELLGGGLPTPFAQKRQPKFLKKNLGDKAAENFLNLSESFANDRAIAESSLESMAGRGSDYSSKMRKKYRDLRRKGTAYVQPYALFEQMK